MTIEVLAASSEGELEYRVYTEGESPKDEWVPNQPKGDTAKATLRSEQMSYGSGDTYHLVIEARDKKTKNVQKYPLTLVRSVTVQQDNPRNPRNSTQRSDMPFPDERDRNIIRRAEQVENLATGFVRLAFGVQSGAETDRTAAGQRERRVRGLAASPPGRQPLHLVEGAGGGGGLRGLAGGQEPLHGPGAPPAERELLPHRRRRNAGRTGLLQEPLLRQRPESAVRLAGGHGPGDPFHHQGPHRGRRLAAVSGDGPGVDAGRVAAGAGPRFPCRVQDARHDLAAGRTGRALRGPRPASIPSSRSIASGGWTSSTPFPTCGRSIAAASRPPRR